MKISEKRIIELQKIFKEEYGKKLSFAEAKEVSNNLVGYFDLLLKIDRRNNPEKYKKINKRKLKP